MVLIDAPMSNVGAGSIGFGRCAPPSISHRQITVKVGGRFLHVQSSKARDILGVPAKPIVDVYRLSSIEKVRIVASIDRAHCIQDDPVLMRIRVVHG